MQDLGFPASVLTVTARHVTLIPSPDRAPSLAVAGSFHLAPCPSLLASTCERSLVEPMLRNFYLRDAVPYGPTHFQDLMERGRVRKATASKISIFESRTRDSLPERVDFAGV